MIKILLVIALSSGLNWTMINDTQYKDHEACTTYAQSPGAQREAMFAVSTISKQLEAKPKFGKVDAFGLYCVNAEEYGLIMEVITERNRAAYKRMETEQDS